MGLKAINLKSINARLKEINTDVNFVDEKEALCKLKVLLEQQKELRKKIKALEEELDIKIESKYSNLEDDEIKKLVIYERWIKRISLHINNELELICQNLTDRIIELAGRYETPLSKLNKDIESISKKVNEHLNRIGKKSD